MVSLVKGHHLLLTFPTDKQAMITLYYHKRLFALCVVASAVVVSAPLTGCEKPAAETAATQEISPEAQIKKIEDNPNISPEVKANLIASIRARTGKQPGAAASPR
jgi:hypothetical protein